MKHFLFAPALAIFTSIATAAPVEHLFARSGPPPPPLDPPAVSQRHHPHDVFCRSSLNRHLLRGPHQPAYPPTHQQHHVQGPGQPPHNPQQPHAQQSLQYEPCPKVLLEYLQSPRWSSPPHQQLAKAKLAYLEAIEAGWKAVNHAVAAYERQCGDPESWRRHVTAIRKELYMSLERYWDYQRAEKDKNPNFHWDGDVAIAMARKARAEGVIGQAHRFGVFDSPLILRVLRN